MNNYQLGLSRLTEEGIMTAKEESGRRSSRWKVTLPDLTITKIHLPLAFYLLRIPQMVTKASQDQAQSLHHAFVSRTLSISLA